MTDQRANEKIVLMVPGESKRNRADHEDEKNAGADGDSDFAPVSAVIPVARRPELLAEAIASICTGRRKPRELIVVLNAGATYPDAGTPEFSPTELQEPNADRLADRRAAEAAFARFRTTGIRFALVECESAGPGPARNAGVAAAREDWLAFLDSDDLWAPDKLDRQWRYLAARPHLRAAHTAEVWIKNGRVLTQPAQLRPHTGRFLRASFYNCLISCSALMLRRETFAKLGGFDADFAVCEDFELWLRYLLRLPIGLVPEALTIKRAGDWPQESRRFHSLDALRIRAILKLVRTEGGRLSPLEREAARAACESKLAILEQGARRRDRDAEITPLASEVRELFARF
ncbi:MAG: glycosyltransferase [Leptospirales bacterium]